MYTKRFDDQLNKISHFAQYPTMLPFIGENYGRDASGKMFLLIGESHYLPDKSQSSSDAANWYNGNESSLTQYEKNWIHTREILSCEWNSPGHFIFRELENRMAASVPVFSGRAMNSCAYMNGFQRPSPAEGDSIKTFIQDSDIENSIKIIKEVIKVIQPNLVIFTSKLTWDWLANGVQESFPGIRFDFVCHPGTGGRHWHRKGYAHGVNKFIELIS